MNLEAVNCAFCKDADSELVYAVPSLRLRSSGQHFNLRRCKKCDLVFLSPRPVESEMALLYQPKFYNSPNKKLVQLVEGMILRERTSFVRARLHTAKLLDVGCGDGSFLNAMADSGFDVHGIEPYQSALPNMRESLRSRVACVPFESAAYPHNNFDVVTLWHVLEHLSRPVETLQKLGESLKPGGMLILEVPNFASPEARWLGPYWYNLDAPYHFWHFTPKTLEAVAQKAGFQVVESVTSAITRPVWLLNYLLLGAKAAADWWQYKYPTFCPAPVAKLLGLLSCLGNRIYFARRCPMLRLVCRKI